MKNYGNPVHCMDARNTKHTISKTVFQARKTGWMTRLLLEILVSNIEISEKLTFGKVQVMASGKLELDP